jgi:hypothetical protein
MKYGILRVKKMSKDNKFIIDTEKYDNALNSVLWYNGLWRIVQSWKNLKPDKYFVDCPPHYGLEEPCDGKDEAQLQVFWIMAVTLFGDYGTSPRYGWIDKKRWSDFCQWIDNICGDCEYWEKMHDEQGF